MDDRDALGFLSGEFRCGNTERRFRQSQAAAELRQLRLLWSAALACFLCYLPLDYLLSAGLPDMLLWGRCGILLVGACVLGLLQVPAWQVHRDWIASAGLCLAMVGYGVVLGARGQGTGALLLLLLGSYLFSPCRFSLHCATGVAGSVAAVAAAGRLPWLDVSYLLPANLLAALALAQLNRGRRRLYRANRQNQALLYNTLPPKVAAQLRRNPGQRPARTVDNACVLFSDLVGFTGLARQLSPGELLTLLDRIFTEFDDIAMRNDLEKIKTIGDAYLAVAGLEAVGVEPARGAARAALEQQRALAAIAGDTGLTLGLRVGMHRGTVVAGVIGSARYAFDVWGQTVNIASRLQAAAPPGGILVSADLRRACGDSFRFGPERLLDLRGCGSVLASPLYRAHSARRSTSSAASASAVPASQSTVMSAKRS